MIPLDFVTEWRAKAPWIQDSQVEQDLVLSRALVEIFDLPEARDALAFRGGTALYKLHLTPPARYSEDIDLVQVAAGPIGRLLDTVRARLDPWLGTPRRTLKEGRVVLLYRTQSDGPTPLPMRLKIEINSREHFSARRASFRWWRTAKPRLSPRYTHGTPRSAAPVRQRAPTFANRLIRAKNSCSLTCATERQKSPKNQKDTA